jgi:hypothetical protein
MTGKCVHSIDDTFRILKRIPYHEMSALYDLTFYSLEGEDTDALFEKHGWTFDEYCQYKYKVILIEWNK